MSKTLVKRAWANFLLRPIVDWPLSVLALVIIRFAGPIPRSGLILNNLSQPSRGSVYITLAAVAGALLGFFIASVAILLSLFAAPSESVESVFAGGRANLMVPTFFAAIRTAGLLTAVSLVLLLVDSSPKVSIGWIVAILLLLFEMIIRTGRLVWLVWRLTRAAAADASSAKTKAQIAAEVAESL